MALDFRAATRLFVGQRAVNDRCCFLQQETLLTHGDAFTVSLLNVANRLKLDSLAV